MKASDASLNLLAVELARLGETIRSQAPDLADAGSALMGIQRQLAASAAPGAGSSGDSSGSATSSKPRKSQSRAKLLKSLLDDVEQLTLMLVARDMASDMSSETLREFRESVIENATQRRQHLADLAFVHSLLLGQAASKAEPATAGSGAEAGTDSGVGAGARADSSSNSPSQQKTISVALAELADMFARCGGQILTEYSPDNQQHFEVTGQGKVMHVLRPAYIATNHDGRTMVVTRGAIEGRES